jgi:hypothetical protein
VLLVAINCMTCNFLSNGAKRNHLAFRSSVRRPKSPLGFSDRQKQRARLAKVRLSAADPKVLDYGCAVSPENLSGQNLFLQPPIMAPVPQASPLDSQSRRGSCLCRRVQYSVHGSALRAQICHCNNCQKTSGSSFGANIIYKKEVCKYALK